MNLFSHHEFHDHEQVVFCHDAASGLKAIIAVHNTNLGPALGGCRMFPYLDDAAALNDVLRLSRGMTYKSALAGLPLGGGKSVIIGDPLSGKSVALMRAMGRAIDRLGGRYIGAEDSGTGVDDLLEMARETEHVSGIRERVGAHGPRDGDPSPYTAYGVYCGLRAAVQHRLGTDSLQGLRVAVQGLGSVGMHLARRLHQAGARLWVTDPVAARVQQAVADLGAEAVELDRIYSAPVDVFAPCAMGAVINDVTIPKLQAMVVAGAANNQLEAARHAAELQARGVLYAPDYVINAGGIIDIHYELTRGEEAEELVKIEGIAETLREIFRVSEKSALTPAQVADQLAEKRFLKGSLGSHASAA